MTKINYFLFDALNKNSFFLLNRLQIFLKLFTHYILRYDEKYYHHDLVICATVNNLML